MGKIKLYLPLYDVELISYTTDLPARKILDIYKTDKDEIKKIGILDFDERKNTLINKPDMVKFTHPIINEIINKFKEMKLSNVGYGNIRSGTKFEYNGTKYLTIKDFFSYLKIDNREQSINKIIKNKL